MSEVVTTSSETQDRAGVRILVVEDERLVAVDIKHRLKRLGYTVVRVVADGKSAIAATAELLPSLVLMDIGLEGGMDGIEAADEIGKLCHVPVIFVTANANDEVLHRALHGNAVGYVLKPFRDREIVVSIEMAVYQAEAERRLREARWWTDNTLETISEGVIAVDHDSVLRYMNSSAELLTGWSRDEALSQTVDAVLRTKPLASGPFDQTHDPNASASVQTGPAYLAQRVQLQTKNGTFVPIEILERILYSPEGEPCGTVYSIKDIGEYLRYEGELRTSRQEAIEAARARSEFVANMSHELRTPLNSIIGMSELALERAESGEQREFLGILRNSGESLLSLINGILDFSKIEAGRMKVDEQEFELLELFQVCLEHIAAQAHKKKVRVVLDLPREVAGKLKTDKQKVKQILLNLLSNSVKFTDQGEILLRASRVSSVSSDSPDSEDRLRLEVRDSGVGIPPDKLDSVFQAFTQIDGSATRNYGGTGIGLAITRSLVELLGGEVVVQSEPGKGTAFMVELPVRSASYGLTPRPAFAGRVLHLASNSEPERRFLEDWLVHAGLEVRSFSGLQELKLAQEDGEGADLLLALGLRGVDAEEAAGLQASKTELPAFVSLPIAGAAAHAGVRKNGFVLNEPLRIELLLHRLEAALSGSAESPTDAEAPETVTGQPVGAAPVLRSPERRLVVLLADDDNINRFVNGKLVEQMGHKVVRAENGRRAIEKLRRMEVDLVLMDLEMPEMDGLTAASAIRKGEAGEHVMNTPIVAVTAHTTEEDRRRVFAEGMNAMLVKPFAMDSLAEVISEVTGVVTRRQESPVGNKGTEHHMNGNQRHDKEAPVLTELYRQLRAFLEEVPKGNETADLEETRRVAAVLRRAAKDAGTVEIDNLLFRVILACRRVDTEGVVSLVRELEGVLDEVSRS